MTETYAITGKSTTLKQYADVHDTIAAIKRIVKKNAPVLYGLSADIEGRNAVATFRNIWDYVRENIRYQNDEPGKEQLRIPQRTLMDRTGDCDDMSILISALLTNMGYDHELNIAAYKKADQWQHIYPVVYNEYGNRYVLDCVPEIPYFNYEAQPIKNKITVPMKLEELGSAVSAEVISELTEPFDENSLRGFDSELDALVNIQGLLGNIVIVDEDDEYDSVLSGSELQTNIILKQLMDARSALENEIRNPGEMSQVNDNMTDLRLVNNIIENFEDEDAREQAIAEAIKQGTLYANFYKAISIGLDDAVNGLAGDDDAYYLQVMDEYGLYDDMEGLGLLDKLKAKVKAGVQKLKEEHPKLAKVGQALVKYNPATVTLRVSMQAFLKANAFRMGEKLAIGYASEAEAKNLGYSKAEWQEFVKAKDQAEQKWAALGGDKANFKAMVQESRGAKKAGLSGQLGIAPVVIAAVTKVFGAVIAIFKKLKLKHKDGSYVDESADENGIPTPAPNAQLPTKKSNNMTPENPQYPAANKSTDANVQVDEKSGVITETIVDESGKETTIYRDKEGNEISKFKAFMLKHKTMIIIVAVVLTVGITALIIWKVRQRSLHGLGEAGLSRKQENFIKRQGLNNRAYASLVREEIKKDKKPYNSEMRRNYYKKIFSDAFRRPLSSSQVAAAKNYNNMYVTVRKLAKAKGGGAQAWREAWSEVKKKRSQSTQPVQRNEKEKTHIRSQT